MRQGTREAMLAQLAHIITTHSGSRPCRVAVDGPPASGKTTLADELADLLRQQGNMVLRATIDDFLYPRERRYRRGEFSGEGCYQDAHDLESLTHLLLDPLSAGGDRHVRLAAFDSAHDAYLNLEPVVAADDSIMIFDGVFLLRPELRDRWELSILVKTSFEATIGRALVREAETGSEHITRRWRERYIPAQELYFATARPEDIVTVVVDNDDLAQPQWRIRSDDQPVR